MAFYVLQFSVNMKSELSVNMKSELFSSVTVNTLLSFDIWAKVSPPHFLA